jgi:hypothetical protein
MELLVMVTQPQAVVELLVQVEQQLAALAQEPDWNPELWTQVVAAQRAWEPTLAGLVVVQQPEELALSPQQQSPREGVPGQALRLLPRVAEVQVQAREPTELKVVVPT